MAYISQYSGEEIDKAIMKANLLDENGKAPSAYIADTANFAENANHAVNADNAVDGEMANYATSAGTAQLAINCPNYLPLSGGTVTGDITVNGLIQNEIYHCEVFYSGSGDTSFSTVGPIVFNNVIQNIGNCYNSNTGYFTCPVKGIYHISFVYYSNNTSASVRPALLVNGNMRLISNGPYGKSLNASLYCNAGTTLGVGCYNASYPVNFYAASGHNLMTVTLISRME